MHLFSNTFYLVLLVTASSSAAAHPEPEAAKQLFGRDYGSSCAGTPFTTVALSTIPTVITSIITTQTVVQVPTTVTIPHSCYTQLIPVPQSNNAFCGTFSDHCGPTPDCIILSTFTQPCRDRCCPQTPTITTLGGCKTCQTGCATQTKYVQQTEGCHTKKYW